MLRSLVAANGMDGFLAAAGALVAYAFMELFKAMLVRGREESMRKVATEQFQAQKLADALEKIEVLTHERDEWREKYFDLLRKSHE